MSRAIVVESPVLQAILTDLAEAQENQSFMLRLKSLAIRYEKAAKESSGDPIPSDFTRVLPSLKDGKREAWRPRTGDELRVAGRLLSNLLLLEGFAKAAYVDDMPTRVANDLILIMR
jgi:hypothetical protein